MNAAELGLIGAVLGMLPAAIGGVFSWLRSRDYLSRLRRREELRKIEIENLSSWIDVALKIPDKETSERHLLLASRKLDALNDIAEESLSEITRTDPTVAGKSVFWRTALFALTGFGLFLLLGMSIDENNQVSFSQTMQEFRDPDGQMVWIFFAILWIVFFYKYWRSRA